MSKQTYRFYRLDGVGHLHSADWFDAESDEDAIAHVGAQYPDATCELWQGEQLVAKVSPKRRQT